MLVVDFLLTAGTTCGRNKPRRTTSRVSILRGRRPSAAYGAMISTRLRPHFLFHVRLTVVLFGKRSDTGLMRAVRLIVPPVESDRSGFLVGDFRLRSRGTSLKVLAGRSASFKRSSSGA
jgi:hypothetical protein